ncbi:MAG TPA: nucleotidyltransferase family protein [Gemmatimonadaceae bacterium]
MILARGLGTRMRSQDSGAKLDAAQATVAETGLKAMIPMGRPFLDYVLSALADAGYSEVCLVIGPEHARVREYYEKEANVTRLRIVLAEQARPLGTADAVLAAERFAGNDPFVVLNSDNYYPTTALAALRRSAPPALVGFDRDTLIERGNVPADRVGRFGALEIDNDGNLVRIATADPKMRRTESVYASMNCWLFTPTIFRACREVPLSPRGELELPRAVQLAVDKYGEKFRVIRMSEAVLDLSSRGDIASVAARLTATNVSL